jgi:hypothetical protein
VAENQAKKIIGLAFHIYNFFTRVEACLEEITVQVRRCKWYHTFLKTGADRNGRGVKV